VGLQCRQLVGGALAESNKADPIRLQLLERTGLKSNGYEMGTYLSSATPHHVSIFLTFQPGEAVDHMRTDGIDRTPKKSKFETHSPCIVLFQDP
jgi:hypothetical protein